MEKHGKERTKPSSFYWKLSMSSQIFSKVTMPASEYKKAALGKLLAYLPITRREEVSPTCRNTVNGN